MFRNLPADLNRHIFSFFSSDEVINKKTINKSTKNLASDSLLWKNLLKMDFCTPDLKEVKEPELEYKKSFEQFLIEREKLIAYMTTVLYSLELEKQENAHTIRDRTYDTHNNRIEDLDIAIFKSENHLLDAYKKITAHSEINVQNIQQKVDAFVAGDVLAIPSEHKEAFLMALALAPIKLNLSTWNQLGLTRAKFDEPQLNRLLFIASRFLNLHAAKLLIELGAKLNTYHVDIIWHLPSTSITTCLFETVFGRHNVDEDVEKTKLFIEFLLNHKADPDMKVFWTNEGESIRELSEDECEKRKKSVRDLCIEVKTNGADSPAFTQLLDLIIAAPKLTSEEPPLKKMRI